MEKMDFGIVNYNGGGLLLECIESLLSLKVPKEIYVIDNASSDDSIAKAKACFPEVHFLEEKENLGYAGAINKMVQKFENPFSVFLNMDLTLAEDWAEEIQKTFAEFPELSSVGSLVLETGEKLRVNSAGIQFFKDLYPQSVDSGKVYTGQEVWDLDVFGSYGALMTFRREVLDEILFDEDYFLFYEETDFFLRFQLKGFKIKMNPLAKAYHYRSFATKRYSLRKLFLPERNRVQSVLKLCPIWYWPLAQVYTLVRYFKMATQKPEGNEKGAEEFPSKFAILFTLFKAWGAAYLNLPELWKKRKAFWKTTNSSPRDTLKLIRKYALTAEDLRMR